MKPWLYIPVETKVRELDAKITLACAAAQQNYNVILARKAEISRYISLLPPGLFLSYAGQKNFAAFYERLKSSGHIVIGMDEEGLVRFSDEAYCKMKLSHETVQHMALFLSWGKDHGDVVRNFTKNKSDLPVVDVGNLRFDLLRDDLRQKIDTQAKEIRKKYGRIILINSNMGAHNHYLGRENYLKSLKTKKVIQTQEDEIFYNRWLDLQKKLFESYRLALPKLSAAFPQHNIIVRPHPSEDKSVWENMAKEKDNIKVICEGSVHPWLAASDVLIHGFCTTPLEGFALAVPLIAYRPYKDIIIENDTPFLGSIEATTPDDLVTQINCIMDNKKNKPDKNTLKKHIENINGAYAFENILNALKPLSKPQSEKLPYLPLKYRYFRHRLNILLEQIKNNQGPQFYYTNHKFPNFTESDIRLEEKNLKKVLSDYRDVKVTKIDPFCYMIQAD